MLVVRIGIGDFEIRVSDRIGVSVTYVHSILRCRFFSSVTATTPLWGQSAVDFLLRT